MSWCKRLPTQTTEASHIFDFLPVHKRGSVGIMGGIIVYMPIKPCNFLLYNIAWVFTGSNLALILRYYTFFSAGASQVLLHLVVSLSLVVEKRELKQKLEIFRVPAFLIEGHSDLFVVAIRKSVHHCALYPVIEFTFFLTTSLEPLPVSSINPYSDTAHIRIPPDSEDQLLKAGSCPL